MEKVTIKSGIFEVSLTKEDVEEIYNDRKFLLDAVLYFVNKKAATEDWDISMTFEEAEKGIKEMLLESGFGKENIDRFFGDKNEKS